jgi:hypothetical protein
VLIWSEESAARLLAGWLCGRQERVWRKVLGRKYEVKTVHLSVVRGPRGTYTNLHMTHDPYTKTTNPQPQMPPISLSSLPSPRDAPASFDLTYTTPSSTGRCCRQARGRCNAAETVRSRCKKKAVACHDHSEHVLDCVRDGKTCDAHGSTRTAHAPSECQRWDALPCPAPSPRRRLVVDKALDSAFGCDAQT